MALVSCSGARLLLAVSARRYASVRLDRLSACCALALIADARAGNCGQFRFPSSCATSCCLCERLLLRCTTRINRLLLVRLFSAAATCPRSVRHERVAGVGHATLKVSSPNNAFPGFAAVCNAVLRHLLTVPFLMRSRRATDADDYARGQQPFRRD